MITFAPTSDSPVSIEAPLEKGHKILRIPVFNFADLPKVGSKEKVSLFHEQKGFVVKGHLREVIEDPLGPSGHTGIVEIPNEELEKFKKAKGPWQVYPPLNDKKERKVLNAYEVTF
jgi:hypothetical protein